MKNVSLTSQLSQEIFNSTQRFSDEVARPHQFNLREILRGMVLSGSTHLSKIVRASGNVKNERKAVERLSNALEKFSVESFAKIHAQSLVNQYRNEPVLVLSDGGDIQKPFAKKMEKVGAAVDGSNGHKPGKGYPIHGLMVLGLDSGKLSPIALHLYSTLDEDFKSSWDEETKNFGLVDPLIKSSAFDRIIVEDRGCDDEKRFLYFVNELESSFVTRIHAGTRSRKVLVQMDHGESEIIKIQELGQKLKSKAGRSRIWFNKKVRKNLTSKIAFMKVSLPTHPGIPLSAIFCFSEGYEEPLVILTDLETDNFEKAWKHFFYYKKRWEVENFYRGIKQQFGAEEFLILGFEAIRALMFLVMLAYALIMRIKQKALDFFGMIWEVFKDFCHQRQLSGNHHLDILAFLRSQIPNFENAHHYRFYSRQFKKILYQSTKFQLKIFDERELW